MQDDPLDIIAQPHSKEDISAVTPDLDDFRRHISAFPDVWDGIDIEQWHRVFAAALSEEIEELVADVLWHDARSDVSRVGTNQQGVWWISVSEPQLLVERAVARVEEEVGAIPDFPDDWAFDLHESLELDLLDGPVVRFRFG